MVSPINVRWYTVADLRPPIWSFGEAGRTMLVLFDNLSMRPLDHIEVWNCQSGVCDLDIEYEVNLDKSRNLNWFVILTFQSFPPELLSFIRSCLTVSHLERYNFFYNFLDRSRRHGFFFCYLMLVGIAEHNFVPLYLQVIFLKEEILIKKKKKVWFYFPW